MGILRFLLAISVVIAHSGPILGAYLVDSNVAVETFFMISGFYMALVLGERYNSTENDNRAFFLNRAIRIFPIYWVVLFASVIVSFIPVSNGTVVRDLAFRNAWENFNQLSVGSIIVVVFANLFILLQDMFMFMALDPDSGTFRFTSDYHQSVISVHKFILVPQAWTLSLEIVFYTCAPILAKKGSKLVLGLLFCSVITRLVLRSAGFVHDPWSYRFVFSELSYFCAGMLCYQLYLRISDKKVVKSLGLSALGVMCCFCLVYSFLPFPMKWILFECAMFLAMPFIFRYTQENHIDRYIGDLSYPIYIGHLLFIMIARTWLWNDFPVGEVVGSILLAILLKEFVGDQFERLRVGARPRMVSA